MRECCCPDAEAADVEERAPPLPPPSTTSSRAGSREEKGDEGHLSYLDVEVTLLAGHDARIPKQKVQAECCRVKAIRWSCFYEGC